MGMLRLEDRHPVFFVVFVFEAEDEVEAELGDGSGTKVTCAVNPHQPETSISGQVPVINHIENTGNYMGGLV